MEPKVNQQEKTLKREVNDGCPRTFGLYKPGVAFGCFDINDITNLRILAAKCNYILIPDPEPQPRTIKIMSMNGERWGYLKKFWHGENVAVPDYVYGFWNGKRYAVKYSILPQITNLANLLDDIKHNKIVRESIRMKRVLIPDLEPDSVKIKLRKLWKPTKSGYVL